MGSGKKMVRKALRFIQAVVFNLPLFFDDLPVYKWTGQNNRMGVLYGYRMGR